MGHWGVGASVVNWGAQLPSHGGGGLLVLAGGCHVGNGVPVRPELPVFQDESDICIFIYDLMVFKSC